MVAGPFGSLAWGSSDLYRRGHPMEPSGRVSGFEIKLYFEPELHMRSGI